MAVFSGKGFGVEKEDYSLDLENKKVVRKSGLRRIEISELPDKLPDLRNSSRTKDNIIAEWLMEWIDNGLKSNSINVNDLLPQKNLIANKTKVSIGTVQTAIRMIEDFGYVESKQRIGTFICDRDCEDKALRKQISKRELAVEAIKKAIVQNGYREGEALPSSRELSKLIGSAPNTTRLALEFLAQSDIIESKGSRGNKSNWILKSIPEVAEISAGETEIDSDTLVDQVERDIKDLIKNTYNVGDKLMSHYELADTLKVSIKTVHDAMKRLIEQRILQSKRGRYGTFILRIPSDQQVITGKESEIFAPAIEASLYNYEKVETYLKNYIKENYKVGDKLPAMSKLAEELNVSSNTIRKALQILSEVGVVEFSRGRYGGTFVTRMPKVEEQSEEKASLKWLAVNPEHTRVYQN